MPTLRYTDPSGALHEPLVLPVPALPTAASSELVVHPGTSDGRAGVRNHSGSMPESKRESDRAPPR